MVTDGERRAAANTIRRYNGQANCMYLVKYAACRGDMDAGESAFLNRLADLIEPEPEERTCRDVSRGGENFKCSECGTVVEVEHDDSLLYIGGLTDDFDYCPRCGAKVVEK